jgi:hypothetical protein
MSDQWFRGGVVSTGGSPSCPACVGERFVSAICYQDAKGRVRELGEVCISGLERDQFSSNWEPDALSRLLAGYSM